MAPPVPDKRALLLLLFDEDHKIVSKRKQPNFQRRRAFSINRSTDFATITAISAPIQITPAQFCGNRASTIRYWFGPLRLQQRDRAR